MLINGATRIGAAGFKPQDPRSVKSMRVLTPQSPDPPGFETKRVDAFRPTSHLAASRVSSEVILLNWVAAPVPQSNLEKSVGLALVNPRTLQQTRVV